MSSKTLGTFEQQSVSSSLRLLGEIGQDLAIIDGTEFENSDKFSGNDPPFDCLTAGQVEQRKSTLNAVPLNVSSPSRAHTLLTHWLQWACSRHEGRKEERKIDKNSKNSFIKISVSIFLINLILDSLIFTT